MQRATPLHTDATSEAIHTLTACQAAERIRAGTLSSEQLVGACLARIEERESAVGAWQYLDAQQAMESARAADRSPATGALHGVPIGVKDIIDTFDMPTTLGSGLYASRHPQWDAACVAAARAAGAVVLGKTVTTEFAYFAPGKTRNPCNTNHTPGGSSSGSAAAVADCMVPIALGSQTAASVIRPAAYCGVLGYRPSFGEFSLSGIRPFAESLDTLGILARSVEDVALMRSVLVDRANHETFVRLTKPPRIGFCATAQWTLVAPALQTALMQAADAFRRAGATVDDLALPDHFAALIEMHKTIMAFEAATNYVFETTRFPQQLSEQFREICDRGRRISRDAYLRAKADVAAAARELSTILSDYDVLMTPAAPGEAPLVENGTGDPVMSRMWTALHVPALSIPIGKGPRGLPFGAQLIAGYRDDDRLLQAGQWAGEVLRRHA